MESSRRNFLRNFSLGIGGITSAIPLLSAGSKEIDKYSSTKPGFNMSGYGAPKLDTVKVGVIGLGNRGLYTLPGRIVIDGVEIKALCDKIPDRVTSAQETLKKAGLPPAKEFTGEDGWKKMLDSTDLDMVYICTPWKLHTPMAVYAMQRGKHVFVEVPAAQTVEECWQLVETSESTRRHCMMTENACYDFFELLTLNMARDGVFGELIHAEGAYIHDLVEFNFTKGAETNDWRLWENATRNGNLYPTHGLGPIAQCMNINRGDVLTQMVSMSSNDFSMKKKAEEKSVSDEFYKQFTSKQFRGNMNNSIIKTQKGKTILVQHDVSSPRPYSRLHILSGTKGIAQKYPEPGKIAFGEEWISNEEFKKLEEKYMPAIVKHIGEIALKVGGHGGMDFLMDWRLIDCLRNGLPLDQDVYDAAAWSVVGPLSEKSVKKDSQMVSIPDFTRGNWKTNKPVTLTLEGGATTTVRDLPKS